MNHRPVNCYEAGSCRSMTNHVVKWFLLKQKKRRLLTLVVFRISLGRGSKEDQNSNECRLRVCKLALFCCHLDSQFQNVGNASFARFFLTSKRSKEVFALRTIKKRNKQTNLSSRHTIHPGLGHLVGETGQRITHTVQYIDSTVHRQETRNQSSCLRTLACRTNQNIRMLRLCPS